MKKNPAKKWFKVQEGSIHCSKT